MSDIAITERLVTLIDEYKKHPEKLWLIPVANSTKVGLVASIGYIVNELNCNRRAYDKQCRELHEQITHLMINEGIIIKGHSASALNIRSEMLKWWKELTVECKKSLNCHGNKIQLRDYINNYRGGKGYEILLETADIFNKELIEIGMLKSDYVLTKDRSALLDKTYVGKGKAKDKRWKELADIPLNSVSDLLEEGESDFIQVEQLFSSKMKGVPSTSAKGNYEQGFHHFSKFLIESNTPRNARLKDILHPHMLSRFKHDYLSKRLEKTTLAPKTAETILSSVRQCIKRATQIKGLGFTLFYDVAGFDVSGRATNMYKPYSVQERLSIDKAIKSDISDIKGLSQPYVKTNVGEYPLLPDGSVKPGKGNIQNARFLFENYLDCKPVFHHEEKSIEAVSFIKMISAVDLGLHEVYKQWGRLPCVDRDIITVFILRLAQITGMNSDSICMLDVDDFVLEHPATGKPCLRYWKERGGGGKELHLDLFKAELSWLTTSQTQDVKDVFETVKKLTSVFRGNADERIINRLFICQSSGARTYQEILAVDNLAQSSSNNFIEKHKLVDELGNPTQLNIARFRPSFVSDLIEKGVSIREIQLMLGHKNIETTMNYLDGLDFSRVARDKVKQALKNIHKRVFTEKNKDPKSKNYLENKDNIIFKTPLASCANIFNPPDFIKNSKLYIENQPCSQFNKCLGCDNVMLTASHLPELFALQRDYIRSSQNNRIMDTPYAMVIEENLSLLSEILSPKTSDFSEQELIDGDRLSMFVETTEMDGVIV